MHVRKHSALLEPRGPRDLR